ncbi:hypothetical protein AWB77_04803 [Caballeronia fortuita]|uniref:Uncharacterized protein n=1 Tax=Caballeronia fortuita TaxID=1777138 RepID=A0A158D1S1_9BURK|nr:hypothetical protein [Caballeronia fortuita]SAK88614.1 hypothetical protein AWB77_04803 [Caballeronia fortuita]
MNGIFDSVEQALHVSFLVTSMPARQRNTFRMALIQILESVGILSDRQESFLAYLRGEKSGSVDFSGLSADEVRAQCAMVVATVADQLPENERNALWIRFARGIPARPKSATVAADCGVPPSKEWKRGVFGVANEMRTTLTISNRDAIVALIAAHAFPHQREREFSYANLSKEFGIPVRTLERAAFTIRKRLRVLEHQAIDRLHLLFERDGLVSTEECCETA